MTVAIIISVASGWVLGFLHGSESRIWWWR